MYVVLFCLFCFVLVGKGYYFRAIISSVAQDMITKATILISNSRNKTSDTADVATGEKNIDVVTCYKYLVVGLDECLSFELHVETFVKKLRLKFGFYL